jgi:hypothetical protein
MLHVKVAKCKSFVFNDEKKLMLKRLNSEFTRSFVGYILTFSFLISFILTFLILFFK